MRRTTLPGRMPWGKYKDWPLPQVPADYLVWILANADPGARLRREIQGELSRRGVPFYRPPHCPFCDAPRDWEMQTCGEIDTGEVLSLVRAVYHELAREYHPDRNVGHAEAVGKFTAAGEFKDRLLRRLECLT